MTVTITKKRFVVSPVHKWGKYSSPYQVLDSEEEANGVVEKHTLQRFKDEWNFRVFPIHVKVKVKLTEAEQQN